MRLLVTRPEPDASAFAEELRGLGHEPILEPLLEFNPVAFDTLPLRDAHAFVITSGNALRAVADSAAQLAHSPFYCVGEETARRARSLGLEKLIACADTAERLADVIAATARATHPIVHLSGEHQAFDLAEALRRQGFSTRTVTVYSMEARREFSPTVAAMMKAGSLGGVILMSPRTSSIHVSLCRRHALTDCAGTPAYFCISESVASKLAPLRPERVLVPAKPNRKALMELLHTNC